MLNTQYHEKRANEADTINLEALARKLSIAFSHECGFRQLPWMQRGFYQLLDEGFDFNMLLHVVFQTSMAPRPSWAYLQAIIRRARLNDAYTERDFVCLPRKDKDKLYQQIEKHSDIDQAEIDEIEAIMRDFRA